MITVNKYVFEDLRGIIGGFLALLGSCSVGLMALASNILVCVVNFLLAELPLDGSLPRYKSSSRSSCGGRDDTEAPGMGDPNSWREPMIFSTSLLNLSTSRTKWPRNSVMIALSTWGSRDTCQQTNVDEIAL